MPVKNRVHARDIYRLLGFKSVQALDHARRQLQMVQDPITGRITAYPDFSRLYPRESPEQLRRREVEFLATAILVVPIWGGTRYPRSAWTYDLARCAALAAGTAPNFEP